MAGPTFYDCAHCDRHPGMRDALGHDGPPRQYWRANLVTGAPLTRCPVRETQLLAERDPALVAEFDRHRLTYYPLYRAGHLLVGGGVSEQPARYLDWMTALAGMEATVQRRHDEITTPDPDEDA